jgi:hypothetical protein
VSYFWALTGAGAAVFAEGWMKTNPGSSWLALTPVLLPFAVYVNFAIYMLLRGDSLLGATVMFTAATALLRVVATLWISQPVPTGMWVAFGLLCLANGVKVVWR